MKKKTVLLSLVLTVALILGAVTASFAAASKGTAKDGNEYTIETAAMNLIKDTDAGGYRNVFTDQFNGWVTSGREMLVIDAMDADSYNSQHVPGAINVEAGDNGGNGPFTDDQKAALKAAAEEYSGPPTVTKYYWNTKTKHWETTKPAAKYWGKCTKKGAYYGKKTRTVTKPVMDKLIVVYCGFTKCKRSHEAAQYLVGLGYKKVYRYPGGISAWVDHELPFEVTEP